MHWLRKRNGNNFIFGLADDDCVPMYNTSSKNPNNYGNYKSGKIKLPSKEVYQNLVFAFKNGYSRQITSKKLIISERLGLSVYTEHELEELKAIAKPADYARIVANNILDGQTEANIKMLEETLEGENTVGTTEPNLNRGGGNSGIFVANSIASFLALIGIIVAATTQIN